MKSLTHFTNLSSTVGILIVAGLILKAGAAPEQLEYEVVLEDGGIEVREYAAMKLVTAPMETAESARSEKDEKKKGDSSFMTLFGYISGANEGDEKIAMTAPVLIDASNPELKTMSFVLPREVVESGVPQPDNDSVEIRGVAMGRYAALRFKGYRSREAEARAAAQLRAWLDEQNLEAAGGALYAYYNAPWTPEFMRRNEVMIRLTDASSKALALR